MFFAVNIGKYLKCLQKCLHCNPKNCTETFQAKKLTINRLTAVDANMRQPPNVNNRGRRKYASMEY